MAEKATSLAGSAEPAAGAAQPVAQPHRGSPGACQDRAKANVAAQRPAAPVLSEEGTATICAYFGPSGYRGGVQSAARAVERRRGPGKAARSASAGTAGSAADGQVQRLSRLTQRKWRMVRSTFASGGQTRGAGVTPPRGMRLGVRAGPRRALGSLPRRVAWYRIAPVSGTPSERPERFLWRSEERRLVQRCTGALAGHRDETGASRSSYEICDVRHTRVHHPPPRR